MVTVVARYRAQQGRGDEVAHLLARHVAETRREPGCIQFVAHRDVEDGDRFLLYEQYVDEAAFADHRASDHFRRNIEEGVASLLSERTWRRFALVEPEVQGRSGAQRASRNSTP